MLNWDSQDTVMEERGPWSTPWGSVTKILPWESHESHLIELLKDRLSNLSHAGHAWAACKVRPLCPSWVSESDSSNL